MRVVMGARAGLTGARRGRDYPSSSHSWRKLLQPGDQDSFLASTVEERKGYRPNNIRRWCERRPGPVPPELIETVDLVPLPRHPASIDEGSGSAESAA
ncbi:hypothetical protein ACFV4K_06515 [Nocardia sp. NPDC059764]|uniref:hypothetical protein n=1 Tax=Nocardia sp. NPDC059764 TaxID=3346939 RepID=UPI0036577416